MTITRTFVSFCETIHKNENCLAKENQIKLQERGCILLLALVKCHLRKEKAMQSMN